MKTFEEKWIAWIDGTLTGRELAEFETSLPDRAGAEIEKQEAAKLGALLKDNCRAPRMGNEDFFNNQLLARIRQADAGAESDPKTERAEELRTGWWTIRRMFSIGFGALAIFGVGAFFVLRETQPPEQSPYLSQILNARVDPAVSPYATISMFQSPEEKVTVLWVDGLQSFPSEYAAK